MKTSIISKVPTVYQANSIASFGMPVKQHADGSFSARMDFRTKKEAINYLIDASAYLCDDDIDYRDMKRDINKYGMLSYDAATATIVSTNSIDLI